MNNDEAPFLVCCQVCLHAFSIKKEMFSFITFLWHQGLRVKVPIASSLVTKAVFYLMYLPTDQLKVKFLVFVSILGQ